MKKDIDRMDYTEGKKYRIVIPKDYNPEEEKNDGVRATAEKFMKLEGRILYVRWASVNWGGVYYVPTLVLYGYHRDWFAFWPHKLIKPARKYKKKESKFKKDFKLFKTNRKAWVDKHSVNVIDPYSIYGDPRLKRSRGIFGSLFDLFF